MRDEEAHDLLAPVEGIRRLTAVGVARGVVSATAWDAVPAAARHLVPMLEDLEHVTVRPGPSTVRVVVVARELLGTRQLPALDDEIPHRGLRARRNVSILEPDQLQNRDRSRGLPAVGETRRLAGARDTRRGGRGGAKQIGVRASE